MFFTAFRAIVYDLSRKLKIRALEKGADNGVKVHWGIQLALIVNQCLYVAG